MADSFKKNFFWPMSATKTQNVSKIWSWEREIIKLYSTIMKNMQKREKNCSNTIFDYTLLLD